MFTARYGLVLYVHNYSKYSLKKGRASSPVLFNFVSEYAIRRVQANHEGLKVNGTLQLPVYVGDVSIVSGSTHTTKKNTKSLTLRLLMLYIYIYGAPILDFSRSHTTTHHSR